MQLEKIETVLSENLGEGYHIVEENNQLSPMIEWVDWIEHTDTNMPFTVSVNFEDETEKEYPSGLLLRQIWHEYAK